MSKERFDRWAPTYDGSVLQRVLFDRIHGLVLEELAEPRPESLLDVGCGTGRLLWRASRRFPGARLAGADASSEMIAAARGKGLAARFEVAAAEKLPFTDACFDAAVTTMSMHHWQEPGTGLREIGRVLRPGGRLVVADLLRGGVYGWIHRLLPPALRDKAFTSEELAALLSDAGLVRCRRRLPRGYGRSIAVTLAVRT